MSQYRTHTCNQLNKSFEGKKVTLCGWVHRRRDHGGLLFIDLRDNYGITQLVIEPSNKIFSQAENLTPESVIMVEGVAGLRPEGTTNEDLATGEVEVHIETLTVLGAAEDLPVPVFGEPDYNEELRLQYRYLDLRRGTLHQTILRRSAIINSLRQRMLKAGFTEFQTPILTSSSPEGARDYLIPSRLHAGKFYALPQAPQVFKQLAMVAGFDKYFQIAPCFRDEDARADRSPGEFYQLDIEMSFVNQEDVLRTVEPIITGVFEEFCEGWPVSPAFARIPYATAMLEYGTDKPDLRNPLRICDVTEHFQDSQVTFQAFRKIIETGGVVRAIPALQAAKQPRSFFDKLNQWAREEQGAAGLGYIIFEQVPVKGDEKQIKASGPIARFIPPHILQAMATKAGLVSGDALFFACDKNSDKAAALAGAARQRIGKTLNLIEEKQYAFCWVVDYPLYVWNEEEKKVVFSHNPFSMPQGGMEALQKKNPLDVLAYQYDLVCNGMELSSGAIRNHRRDIMLKAFALAGYEAGEVEEKFSSLLSAFRYGAPPHGGIAPGIDRMVMLLCQKKNLREVVMFPMNQKAEDLMMGAPAPVDAQQMRDLHLSAVKPKK